MTVKQLNLGGIEGFHQVICVKAHESLLGALSIIGKAYLSHFLNEKEKYNIHGLPVLDEYGKLIGNLSVSDLKVHSYLNTYSIVLG